MSSVRLSQLAMQWNEIYSSVHKSHLHPLGKFAQSSDCFQLVGVFRVEFYLLKFQFEFQLLTFELGHLNLSCNSIH